jgi:hypothetical protein
MIVTSYTSLVVESHKADCANLFGGIARRLPRRPSRPAPAYREQESHLTALPAPALVSVDVPEIVHISSGKIRGAA